MKNSRHEIISEKVTECGQDSKKIFSLVNTLCGTTKCNLIPEDAGSLADDFADFFMAKIKKIRDQLENHPKYALEAGLT